MTTKTHDELKLEHARLCSLHDTLSVEIENTPWWRILRQIRLRREATAVYLQACDVFDEATALYRNGLRQP